MLFILAGEYLYTLMGNIKIYWGYPTFLGLTVDQLCLGESIADSFIIVSLSGESYHYCLTLQGVKVSWSYSSAELTLVPWWIEQLVQLRQFLLPQFLREKVPVEVLDKCSLTNLLLVGK